MKSKRMKSKKLNQKKNKPLSTFLNVQGYRYVIYKIYKVMN